LDHGNIVSINIITELLVCVSENSISCQGYNYKPLKTELNNMLLGRDEMQEIKLCIF
jgi:hypothetical protein